jgi:hypothetical protein
MSISKRFLDMARAELNALLDKASTWDSPHDPDEDLYRRYGLDELTDEQLEAELERRHRARAATKAAPPRQPARRPAPCRAGLRPKTKCAAPTPRWKCR